MQLHRNTKAPPMGILLTKKVAFENATFFY